MRFIYKAAILSITFCAASLPIVAQIPSMGEIPNIGATPGRRGRYTVSGQVRDAESNRPMDSVTVRLVTLGAGISDTTATAANGNFTFNDVPAGSYRLMISEKGFLSLQEDISVNSRPSIGVQLLLKPDRPSASEKVGDGATVSARELTIPPRAREAMARGLQLIKTKSDYKGSLAEFQRALREYPDFYEAYLEMGLAYQKLGDESKYEEMALKSVEISHHKYLDALLTLSTGYSNQKRYAEAEPLARDAVKVNPNSWDAQIELARSRYGLEQFAEAESSALDAQKIRPDDPTLNLLLANIHLKLGNYSALLADLDKYLERSPAGPAADQARQMREQIQKRMAESESGAP